MAGLAVESMRGCEEGGEKASEKGFVSVADQQTLFAVAVRRVT